jgi:putative DNA primase/helicase
LEPRVPKNEVPIGEDGVPKHEPCTDTGNAERLVKLANGDLRFCFDWKKWLHWDGRRWSIEVSGAAMRLSKRVARDFLRIAAGCENEAIRKSYTEWGQKSEKVERRKAMVELAKTEDGIPIAPAQMDQNPLLLNCPNGTLDLAKFELRSHRREDHLTKLCPTKYMPDAQCPEFQKFLSRVLPDPELQQYMQRFFGLSLTGDISEQALQVGVGDGLNGKSTLYCAFLDVLGDGYAIQVSTEMLLATDRDSHPTDLADLFGTRLAIGTETPKGRSLNETRVKLLTGGEPIRARRMREDHWQFIPTHKLVIVTNYMPKVSLDSYAMVRRLHVVPFEVRIPASEIDKRLPQKLRAEREGILAWGVHGLRALRDRGLDPPAGVLLSLSAKTESERRPVAEFIAAHVVRKPGMRTPASKLLVAFTQWCERGGKPIASQTELGIALGHEGFGKQRSGGVYVYLDLALEGLGSPVQGLMGMVGDGCPIDSPCTPHGEINGTTVPKSPQPSPRPDPCRMCGGTTRWRRTADAELFCMRCAPPAHGVPVHEVIDTATGEVVASA